ncbi:PEBP-like protein [Panus rudis PR-1116 ss-1]|nr:PEBP-like protein [Panus rudis PR-1116 ss-1]
MISLSFVRVLSLAAVVLPFAYAQNNTALDIEAIKAHFANAGIVPSLLTSFDPEALVTLNYPGFETVAPGQALTKDQVAPTPGVQVTPANSSVTLNGKYTLAMVDAGPVGTDESQGQTRHWLVNGVSLTGSNPSTVAEDGTVITKYAGPAPPAGSGPHRYVVLLYTQPDSFKAPDDLSAPNTPVSVFNFPDYVKNTGLGPLVGGTYITVEEGTASSSLSSTAPVVTSTLPAATSTSSGSGSGSATASGSNTAAPSTTGGSQSNAGSKTSKVVSVNVLLVAFAAGFFLG